MNIDDPKISRRLAAALQWMPLEDQQTILEKVKRLKTMEELDALLDNRGKSS